MFVTGAEGGLVARVGNGVIQVFWVGRVVGVMIAAGVAVAFGLFSGSFDGVGVGVGVVVLPERMPENEIFEFGKNRVKSPRR